ncbi:MAG: M28 family metallopeptidase [Actinomycetota bacterium]
MRTTAIRRHLEQFQRIADDNGGNRAAGTSGFDASALYVGELLTKAGYEVTYQRFEFPAFIEVRPASLRTLSPDRKEFEPALDFMPLYYSASGRASGSVVSVDVEMDAAEPTSGCESSDFDGFPRGGIALVQQSNCFFRDQVGNAEEAGATGLIVFPGEKLPNDPLLVGTLTPTADVSIPVIGTTHSLGAYLAQAANPRIDMRLRTLTENRMTTNVVAESRWGDAANVVMLGAHLDSVSLGPGINDNGSGSAMILEIARQLPIVDPDKRVRFAFWGAEEVGLFGSFHYTDQLDAAEQEAVAAYLNFDMVGSPNYIRMIYEGRDSGSSDVAGSIAIQKVFEEYFRSRGLDVVVSDLVANRSDQTGFALAGIAVGGLFSGADDVKTEAEKIEFGGTAGARHDPCYHQTCDNLSNVDFRILGQMADAAAYATATLASDRSPLR